MNKKNKAPLVEQKNGKMELSEKHIAAFKEVERVGTSMMETAQEYTLAIEQILVEDFNFTEEQLRHMEERLREMLVTLADIERSGLSILSVHDMELVGEIAKMRYNRLLSKDSGIALPTEGQVKKLNG